MTEAELFSAARSIYDGCGHDMVAADMDLESSADYVADRLYTDYGDCGVDLYQIALKALKGYF